MWSGMTGGSGRMCRRTTEGERSRFKPIYVHTMRGPRRVHRQRKLHSVDVVFGDYLVIDA